MKLKHKLVHKLFIDIIKHFAQKILHISVRDISLLGYTSNNLTSQVAFRLLNLRALDRVGIEMFNQFITESVGKCA